MSTEERFHAPRARVTLCHATAAAVSSILKVAGTRTKKKVSFETMRKTSVAWTMTHELRLVKYLRPFKSVVYVLKKERKKEIHTSAILLPTQ